MLTLNTQNVIDEFLQYYPNEKSKGIYKNAIDRAFIIVNKNDVKLLTFSDLPIIQKEYPHNEMHVKMFFKFIYAFDYIDNKEGFEDLGVKLALQKGFQRKHEKQFQTIQQEDKYGPSLSIIQIDKIESFLNTDKSDNIEIILLGFCWYMLFHTDCDVDVLRTEIDKKNFSNGILSSPSGTFPIPEKFHILFSDVKDKKNTKFNQLSTYITRLGNYIGIENLTPSMITKAQKQNKFACCECGNVYSNSIDYWIAINNRIVCKSCGEIIKKNSSLIIKEIQNNEMPVFTQQDAIELSAALYTFETLRKRMLLDTEYIERYLFQNQIGVAGEAFVYDYERENLRDTEYYNEVDMSKARNPRNGYDILSYDRLGNEKYIEVKTTCNDDNEFFISDYELDTGKRLKALGKTYLIYRVSNILAKSITDIKLEIIDDLVNKEKYSMKTYNWIVSPIK